jgi:hypothetical protein
MGQPRNALLENNQGILTQDAIRIQKKQRYKYLLFKNRDMNVMNNMRRVKPRKLIKTITAFIVAFLILAGGGFVARTLLQQETADLAKTGFAVSSTASWWLYFIVLGMIVFLIYELNKRIPENAIASGLLIALIMTLQEVLFASFYAIPAQISVWNACTYFVSITLASYVFDVLYS